MIKLHIRRFDLMLAIAILSLAASGLIAASLGNANEPLRETSEPAADSQAETYVNKVRICGRVLDAVTGQLIQDIRMVPTMSDRELETNITWQTQYLKEFADGQFVYETDRPWKKTRLRIEAAGYQPAVTRYVDKGENVELEIRLERRVLAGKVRLPNGEPASHAQVALATWTNEIKVDAGKLAYSGHGVKMRNIIETDNEGRFEMPSEIDPSVLIVAHPDGYGELANAETTLARITAGELGKSNKEILDQPTVVDLQAWGRVEGRVQLFNEPVVGAKYWVYQGRSDDVHVATNSSVTTDADGRFLIEHFPPGRFGVCQRYATSPDGQSSHSMNGLISRFEILPGKTISLELGGHDRAVIGKLVIPEGSKHRVDWSTGKLQVSLQPPRFVGVFGGDNEATSSWRTFLRTDEGRQYGRNGVAIEADGSFVIEGLPSAEYQLVVTAKGIDIALDQNTDEITLHGTVSISVPAIVSKPNEPTVDLGTVVLMVSPK